MATIIGVFTDRANADIAATNLRDRGYTTKDFSVVMKDMATGQNRTRSGVLEGVVSGTVAGGMVAGVAGFLIGTGVLVIPDAGVLLIGGPLAAALGLSGAGAMTVSGVVSGAVAGGLVGGLVGLGVPEETVKEYRGYDGMIFLAVSVQENEEAAVVRDVFEVQGAHQIQTV